MTIHFVAADARQGHRHTYRAQRNAFRGHLRTAVAPSTQLATCVGDVYFALPSQEVHMHTASRSCRIVALVGALALTSCRTDQKTITEVTRLAPSTAGITANPGTVTDLSVVSTTNNSATIRFTEVDDGTGQPAKYNVRFAAGQISWGSATDVTQGTCATPVAGTAIGALRTCTVGGLAPSTAYEFQLVAFRGTLNVDAVFGGLSNVAQGTTASGSGGGSWPHEPPGLTPIAETGWEDGTLGSWELIHPETGCAEKFITVEGITDSPINESKALQIFYPQCHIGGGGTEAWYGLPTPRNELFVGYYVQVNPQWQGHCVSLPDDCSAINKMIYLYNGNLEFSAMWYIMFGADNQPLRLYLVSNLPDREIGYGPTDEERFSRGQWHKVEIYQKQGTSNAQGEPNSDGIVRVWVDGVLAREETNVTTGSSPISGVTISGIWGGVGDVKAQDDYMRFDHIYISGR